MVTLVRRLAAERAGQVGGLAFVDDQRGCPSFTADLGPMLRRSRSIAAPGSSI